MKFIKKKNIIWNSVKKLANLNIAIFLLLCIAFLSIFGTIIEQDQSLSYYQQNYPVFAGKWLYINWQIIMHLGLYHVYTTWWFFLLLFLFFLSLMICTFSRQLPSLRNARNWKFLQKKQSMRKFKDHKILEKQLFSNIIYSLNIRSYYVFQRRSNVYAYKGLLGRIAPIFVHISIVLTFTGAIIGLFGGFLVQEMIPSGEIFRVQNVLKAGNRSHLPDIVGRINDFNITYNTDTSIKQFLSSVSLLDNQGNDLIHTTISVNSPLRFKGITFYQTDWQINALRLQIGRSMNIQQELHKIKVGDTYIWVCNLPCNDIKGISLVVTGVDNKILLYDSFGVLVKTLLINQRIQINDSSLIIKEVMVSTGLQIKADPGITIVYIGFFILIISVFISYLSYSQIWASIQITNIELAGSTNRAELTFEEDFMRIEKQYVSFISK